MRSVAHFLVAGKKFIPENLRSRRIALLIFALWLIGMADLYFTLWAASFTPFTELNPAADFFLRHNSHSLVIFKLIGTATGTAIFWLARSRRRTELALWLVVTIYVVLAFRWSGYTQQMLQEKPAQMARCAV